MKATDMDILNCPNVSKTCESIENCPCESCDNNLGYLAVKMTYEKKEQRYQQLEQVARDMLHWFDIFLEEWGEDWELGPDPKDDILHDRKIFRKQLEALGVLDDQRS